MHVTQNTVGKIDIGYYVYCKHIQSTDILNMILIYCTAGSQMHDSRATYGTAAAP